MAKGVTIVDDGTIANRRGSLSFDDEGTQTQPQRAGRGRRGWSATCRTGRMRA